MIRWQFQIGDKMCLLRLQGPTVKAEIERVKSVGGWVEDGRVCGLLAVSRAFGDWELKEEGMDHFLKESLEYVVAHRPLEAKKPFGIEI